MSPLLRKHPRFLDRLKTRPRLICHLPLDIFSTMNSKKYELFGVGYVRRDNGKPYGRFSMGGCGLLRPVAFVMLLSVLKWLVEVPLCPWWFAPYRDFRCQIRCRLFRCVGFG